VAALIFLMARGFHSPELLGIEFSNFWYVMLVVIGLGLVFGISNPSMNNAGLDLAPDRIAAITGLRLMAQQLGGTIGIAIAVQVASRADSESSGFELAFTVFAVLLACSTLLVTRIPEIWSTSGRGDRSTAVEGAPVEGG
jgi:hypothetical protein